MNKLIVMSEAILQAEVVKYISLQYPKAKYCASLGGIYTSPTQAVKAKRTGYKRGFPDLQITEARGGYFGLFLELKTNKGRATKDQKEWVEDLNNRGYKALIVKGIDETINAIDNYMKQENTIISNCKEDYCRLQECL
tara:strand:- start:685 stop:1098 length:414 start_codon:yes stop_codon:yes gene_type:complete